MRINLDEFTRKDIVGATDLKTRDRSKKVRSTQYIGIMPDYTICFRVRSASTPGVTYINKVQMLDYPEAAAEEDLSVRDRVRLAIAGDLKIRCSCPAFKWWGYEYITTELELHKGEDQKIYPHIRNPRLEGVVCKHLYKTLNALPFNIMKVVSDITNERFIQDPER